MLTVDELEAMRAAQEKTMTDMCTIIRRGVSSDGLGGEREVWSVSGSAMCRVGTVSRSPQELVQAERLSHVTPYMVTLPVGVEVNAEDRLEITAAFSRESVRKFEVIGAVRGSFESALRCTCVEII